jgi:type I restriction enzyme S subunit
MRRGWEKTTIGKVFHLKQGSTLAVSKLSGGSYPVYGANGIVGHFNEFNFDFPVTGLGCRGSCGTIYYIQGKAFLANNVMAVWEKDSTKIFSQFIPLLLSNVDLASSGAISGQVQPQITLRSLAPVTITVPPLQEQKKIVDVISSIDSYIFTLKKLASAASNTRQAILEKSLEDYKTRYGCVPLSSVCASGSQSIVDGPFGSNLQRRDYLDVGLPVLKLQNIKEGFILKKNLDYVSAEKYLELIRHSFLLGDIVMTKLGDPLGISSIVSDIEKGLIVADLVRIRPESIDTKFLCMQLNSNSVKFHLNKQQKGSTRPRINLGMVRELPIVNPPGPEVRDLVNLISGFDHHISSIRELVLKNNELRSGILSQLLSGDHEIPDSYDKVMGVA